MSFLECRCECHSSNGRMKHCMPCCSTCMNCLRNIKFGFEEEHKNECSRLIPIPHILTVVPPPLPSTKIEIDIKTDEKDSNKQLTSEEQAVVDDARDLMEKVLARIKANVMKETEDEMLDIIVLPLLEVIRMRQLFLKKLGQLDGRYLDKFLEFQTPEYLTHLKEKIDTELSKRQQ